MTGPSSLSLNLPEEGSFESMVAYSRSQLTFEVTDSMVDAFYNQIGQAAISEAPSLAGRLLVQAEVEDGVISAKLFYEIGADAPLAFRFCSSSLEDLIYSFWQAWRAEEQNKEWRVMCYVIDEGKFSIDLTYPEQVSPDEGDLDRRPGILKKYFGDVRVDYSMPD